MAKMSLRKRRHEAADKSPVHESQSAAAPTYVSDSMDWIRRQPLWIVLAVASGACAAINGVFAKL